MTTKGLAVQAVASRGAKLFHVEQFLAGRDLLQLQNCSTWNNCDGEYTRSRELRIISLICDLALPDP
jgi:hypothetical protein